MTAQKMNCHAIRAAMVRSSTVTEERVVIARKMRANVKEIIAGRGESIQMI